MRQTQSTILQRILTGFNYQLAGCCKRNNDSLSSTTARNFCIMELVTANGNYFDLSSEFEVGYLVALDRRRRCAREGKKQIRNRR
jgi:hypothetical protein